MAPESSDLDAIKDVLASLDGPPAPEPAKAPAPPVAPAPVGDDSFAAPAPAPEKQPEVRAPAPPAAPPAAPPKTETFESPFAGKPRPEAAETVTTDLDLDPDLAPVEEDASFPELGKSDAGNSGFPDLSAGAAAEEEKTPGLPFAVSPGQSDQPDTTPFAAPPKPAATPPVTEDSFAAPQAPPAPEASRAPAASDSAFGAPAAPGKPPAGPGEDPFAAPESPGPSQPQGAGFAAHIADGRESPGSAFSAPSPEAAPPQAGQSPAAPQAPPVAPPQVVAPNGEAPFAAHPETQAAPQSIDVGEPSDILYRIASSGSSRQETAADSIAEVRKEAVHSAPPKSIITRQQEKVKFEALPFDSIVPGNPLVIAIYSPSGGVGKSSTAMNLGICMSIIAQNMAKKQGPDARVPRVLTLDGDIVMGSLSIRLTSKVRPNLYGLQQYADERKAAGFEGDAIWPTSFDSAPPGEMPMYKFTHWPDYPSNFSVLAAPEDPKQFFHFGPSHYREILRMLGKFYDVIIIDCGTELVMDSQRAWLQHANEVFLITSPDSDRIFNAAKAANIIASSAPHPQDQRGERAQKLPPLASREKLNLVVIKSDIDSGLPLEIVINEKLFAWMDKSRKFWVPDVSTEITKANNKGEFLVTKHQEYAKVINRMAKHAFGRYVMKKSSQSLPSV